MCYTEFSEMFGQGVYAMIKVLLWDIDGTILDFLAAEKVAMKKCFEVCGIGECTDEMIVRYSIINKKYWEKLCDEYKIPL